MKTFAPKSKTETQQARNHPTSRESEAASGFVDNLPEAIAQRKLQDMMHQSPQVQRLAQLQAKMNNSPRVNALAQLQARIDNNPRQVAQRKQFERMFGQRAGETSEASDVQGEPITASGERVRINVLSSSAERPIKLIQRFGEFGEDGDQRFAEFVLQEDDLNNILEEIGNEADDDDRKAFLKDDALKAQVKDKHGNKGLTAIIGKLFVGLLKHQNPVITQDSENFFQGWLAGNQESIADQEEGVDFDEQTMNCWESVLYTAIQAGVAPKAPIAEMYATAKTQGSAGQLMADVYAYLRGGQGAPQTINVSANLLQIQAVVDVRDSVVGGPGQINFMNWSRQKKGMIQKEAKTLVEQGRPTAGQLVIYERTGGPVGPTHVALCLGGNKIATLNGKGQAVEEHEIGDWQEVFPEDDDNQLTLDLLENGWQIHFIDPPWA